MKNSTIKYIRLVTGDEIISEVVSKIDRFLLINPMILEYMSMTGGANFPFMTRYNPYSIDHSVIIDPSHIIFISETTPEMLGYYKTSLNYAEETCDKLVIDRVIEADRYIVDADTPASPITTSPPDKSQEVFSFPPHLTLQ